MRTFHHHLPARRHAPRRQSGIVLVVALIIMGVMAIASTAALKLALSGSQIAQGLRTANLAMQAAESGLRWCELQTRLWAVNQPSAMTPQPAQANDLTRLWRTRANFGTAMAVPVPAAVLNAAGLVNYPVLPDCICEEIALEGVSNPPDPLNPRAFLITARGFSPNYSRTNGETAGGEVWLQSQIYIAHTLQ